jgi:hypothetical protein
MLSMPQYERQTHASNSRRLAIGLQSLPYGRLSGQSEAEGQRISEAQRQTPPEDLGTNIERTSGIPSS